MYECPVIFFHLCQDWELSYMRLLEIARRLFFFCTLEQFQKPSNYLFPGNLEKSPPNNAG